MPDVTPVAQATTDETFLLPDLGEGLTEGEVLKWLVDEGDVVVVNQPVVEVETAKAAVELPSPYAGRVQTRHAGEGQVLAVGSPLLTVQVISASAQLPAQQLSADAAEDRTADAKEGSGPLLVGYGVVHGETRRRSRTRAASPHGTDRPEAGPPGASVKPVRHGGLEIARAAEARFANSNGGNDVLAKPPVRKLARDLGVDLSGVRATGRSGTVTRDDVLAAAALLSPAGGSTGSAAPEGREPMNGVTRAMAQAMTKSAFTIPHVTEWVEVDVSRSVELLERVRRSAAFDGVKVTALTLVARACIASLQRNPRINAVLDEQAQEVVHRSEVNLGVAAATPRGLVVPNIKGADRLQLPELARQLAALTATAKAGKTSPADMANGTFTITNVGVFGVDGGTPLINPGESAILAVGAWREKPWAHHGDLLVRTACTLSLSFDHRFIDGASGSRFLRDVADLLEEPAADLAW